MANTIRAAKNTFNGGMVLDLAPDTTPNEVLTSALNATLVTFNGNELLLQNDMGNGRVETARLPEGYIPVGTCEFGDIIYIVSYNPLTNKSLIGCFPSPERNISSEEIGNTGQILTASDFLELDGTVPTGELKASSVKKIIYENKLNPGDKFIIYDKNNVIFSNNNIKNITDIGNTSHTYGTYPKLLRIHVVAIEDSGKINYLDSSLKWYEKGAGQEDYFIKSSKPAITGTLVPDIDSYRNLLSSGYSVFQSKISGKLALLIELEKITGFSCAYSIYSNKETLNDNFYYKDYKVFWNFSWNTDDPNINPSYIILTKSEWSGKEESLKGKWGYWNNENKLVYSEESLDTLPDCYPEDQYYEAQIVPLIYPTLNYENFILSSSYQVMLEAALLDLRDLDDNITTKLSILRQSDNNGFKLIPIPGRYIYNGIDNTTVEDIVINNYFHYPIYKEFSTFGIPIGQKKTVDGVDYRLNTDISNLIYNYEITPAMPYGLLREYSIEGYIDFSKIGTGVINLNVWKYFIGKNIASLTIGLEAYVEENKGIDEVVLEFYDNQGMAAAYHMGNKESYSGQFTESIPLNGMVNSYKLTDTNHLGETKIHCGPLASDNDTDVLYMNNGVPRKLEGPRNSGTQYYLNDCGTLYSDMLYLVKIVVKYCPLNALGNLETSEQSDYRYYYRWMWTTTVFNEYYYNVQDYNNINLTLTLDANATYSTNSNYIYDILEYNSPSSITASGSSDTVYKNLSSRVQIVTHKEKENLEDPEPYNTQMYMVAGLENNYNVFNLRKNELNENGLDAYNQIKVDIITSADQYTENDEVKILHSGESMLREFEGVYPVLKDSGGSYQWDDTHYGVVYKNLIEDYFPNAESRPDCDLWERSDNYTLYKNQFKLMFKDETTGLYTNSDKEYISYKGLAISFNGCSYMTKMLGDICGEQDKFLYMNTLLMHFSKYYKIYKENSTPTPQLVPLLYDKSDLDKYGLGIDSTNIPYVKYLLDMNFYYGGRGGFDERSYIYMDIYSYNSSQLAYDMSGYIKRLYDDFNTRDFSVYSSNYKNFKTFSSDTLEEWRQFPKGFVLFGIHNESSTQQTFNASDYGGMYQLNYLYPSSYSSIFLLDNYTYHFHLKYLKPKNGTTPLVGIGYYCDSEENLRYFNTYFPTSFINDNVKLYIRYKTGKGTGRPKYIGIVIASLLTSLYIYRQSLVAYPYVSDIIYLDKNSTTFTKDIIYHIYCNNNTEVNDILVFKGCKYTDYLSAITNQFISDADKISKNNIKATLKSCIKNIPILFKMNYLEPNLESTNNINTQSVAKLIDGTEEIITGEIPREDKLYYIDRSEGSHKVKLLDKDFRIRYLKNLQAPINSEDRLVGEYDETVPEEPNQYIYKMFNGTGEELTFEKSDLLSSDIPTYSICTNFHKDCCLHHFRKEDVIAPFAKIF